MVTYERLGTDSDGLEVVGVTEDCPVCGDVSRQIWYGHEAVGGNGFYAERTEVLSDCGH